MRGKGTGEWALATAFECVAFHATVKSILLPGSQE
jgi:hypothetical protein